MPSALTLSVRSRWCPPAIHLTWMPLFEIEASPQVPATSAASIFWTKSALGTISLSTVTYGKSPLNWAAASLRPTSSGAHQVVKRRLIGALLAAGLAAAGALPVAAVGAAAEAAAVVGAAAAAVVGAAAAAAGLVGSAAAGLAGSAGLAGAAVGAAGAPPHAASRAPAPIEPSVITTNRRRVRDEIAMCFLSRWRDLQGA